MGDWRGRVATFMIFSIMTRNVWMTMSPARPIVAVAAALVFICAAASMSMPSVARAAEAASASAPPSAADDARLIDFLQKHYRIPDKKEIDLSAPKAGPFDGMWTRRVTVTMPNGMKEAATIFTDSTGSKFILGQLIDTTGDPWGRISLKGMHLDDRPTIGPDNAPVTIVEFGDFECPFCARATSVLETAVESTYKGKVKLIFKNFPLSMHPWALQAAKAAECVRLQNPTDFWDFANDLYKNQSSINPKNVKNKINQFASRLNLDTKALDACMPAKATQDRLTEDMKDGLSVRVESTPTFFINGIRVVGFPDPKVIDFVLGSEVKASEARASAH
jgi:predicted DsbA family dithiol-disulfide isomerase